MSIQAVRTAATPMAKPTAATLYATLNKKQPWKTFWPPKAENYTLEERASMPWLTWKYDGNKPMDRPWRSWMLENQTTVARRGGL